jgi:hypothetical protein
MWIEAGLVNASVNQLGKSRMTFSWVDIIQLRKDHGHSATNFASLKEEVQNIEEYRLSYLFSNNVDSVSE